MARLVTEGQFRAVIRHRDDGRFYAGAGEWVEGEENALAFWSLESVLDEAEAQGMKDCCDIVVELQESSRFKVFLPL